MAWHYTGDGHDIYINDSFGQVNGLKTAYYHSDSYPDGLKGPASRLPITDTQYFWGGQLIEYKSKYGFWCAFWMVLDWGWQTSWGAIWLPASSSYVYKGIRQTAKGQFDAGGRGAGGIPTYRYLYLANSGNYGDDVAEIAGKNDGPIYQNVATSFSVEGFEYALRPGG